MRWSPQSGARPYPVPSVAAVFVGASQTPPVGVRAVQPVGRLDEDTTGLILISDDGQFIHRMSSPKKHLPKVYEVTVKDRKSVV